MKSHDVFALVNLFLNFEPFGFCKTWFEPYAVAGYSSSAFFFNP
jgi:hypothetical protein